MDESTFEGRIEVAHRPFIQVDDTNSFSMLVDPGFVDFSIFKANVDGADEGIGTVATAAASIIPSTAPNGTHTYGFAHKYVMPVS